VRNVFTANAVLWILQVILALFFGLASGAPKLLLPAEALPMPIPLPQTFLWFIGTCEVLGALGLILPGLTHVQTRLTPIVAALLALLTICAATYQLFAAQPANAVFALAVGALAACIAYGRTRVAPLSGSSTVLAASPTGP
jgi:uncharacterized membrane protein